MKKIPSLLVLSGAMLVLASCGGNGISSESISSSPSSSDTSSSANSSISTEVMRTYELALPSVEHATIEVVTEPIGDGYVYEGGTEVSFKVTPESSRYAIRTVKIDDKELTGNNGVYSFTMPNHKVELQVEVASLGEEGLDAPKEVTQDLIPGDPTAVRELLLKQRNLSQTYFKEGEIHLDSSSSSDERYDYHIRAYQDEVLTVSGTTSGYSGSQTALPFYQEIGKNEAEDKLYTYEKTGSSLSATSGVLNESLSFKVITEDADGILTTEISPEDANLAVSTYDLFDEIISAAFDPESYSGSFIENPNAFSSWDDIQTRSTLSEDRNSWTTTITASEVDSYTGETTYYEFIGEFDGLSFCTSASFTAKTYLASDFVEGGELNPDATPDSSSSIEVSAERGYRPYSTSRISLSDYAMHDYDVRVFGTQEDSYSAVEAVNNEVEVGSTLSFQFKSYDENSFLMLPQLIGAKEEGFFAVNEAGETTLQLIKEGDVTLQFDNGAGDIKEVVLHVVPAKPTSINLSLSSSNVFLGEEVTLTASVTPSLANQEVEISVAEESAGSVSITYDAEAKIYRVKAEALGEVTLNAKSKVDENITASITLSVLEKPNYEDVYNMITTKTMFFDDSYNNGIAMNFNADGTGSYRFGEYDYWSSSLEYEDEATFSYSFDETTLAFTISDVQVNEYYGAELKSITVVNSSTLEATFDYDSYTLTPVDRIDLSTLPGSSY